MANRNSELSFRLTGDPASLLAALEKSRAGMLRTYAAMREGVEQAKGAWADAQAKVQGLAAALGQAGPPTKAQVAELAKVRAEAGRLKDAYLAARDAAQAQQGRLRDNAGASTAARQAVQAAEQQRAAVLATAEASARAVAAKRAEAVEEQRLAAIVTATRARMVAAAQEQLQAERLAAAEAAAAAQRQAQNQAAAVEWARRYAAAKLAAEDRANALARRQVGQQPAAGGGSNVPAARAGVQSISTQLAQIRNVGATVVGAQGLGDLVRVVDAWTSINARLKLASRSTAELALAQRELFAIAQRNGSALGDIAGFYVRIADPVRALGASQTEALRIAEGVSQSLRISGASTNEAASAMQQFAQALGKGVVNGDELQSVLENAPRLARALADGLGVPTTALKEMGEQGALTSAKVLGALRSQLPQIAREAAQLPLTIGQSVTNIQGAFQRYVGGADESAGASRKVAGALNGVAQNFGTVANGAIVAGNALAIGFAASRISGFLAAAGGVTAALLSWPALLALVAGGGTALWLGMGQGAQKSSEEIKGSLRETLREVEGFGDRMSDAQRESAIDGLTAGIKKAKEEYAALSAEAAVGEVGTRIEADIKRGEKALVDLQAKTAQLANKNLTKERGDLGVDKKRTVDLALVDKDQADKLVAFEKLYKAFVRNSINADGDLVTSYQEVRAALDGLIAGAKTPADFDGIISRLTKALKGTIGGGTAPLRAELTSLVEARAQAEEKALGAQVAGLQARVDRAGAYFGAVAEQAKAALIANTGLARVTAELREDTAALSADQASQSRTAATVAQQSASVQIALLRQVEAQKRAIIESDRVAASRVATNARIDAERAAQAQLRGLAAEKATVAPDSARAAEIAAEEKKIATDLAKEKKRLAEASADAQAGAARRVADVERATARQRLEILKQSQADIQGAAGDALANYKTYASQVIQLDRQIAANRLDTAASIEALKRKDMDPAAQADSLRAEMERLRAEEGAAARAGDRNGQQDALARQKSIANDLAGVTGDGVDPKAMRAEAISNLQRIGEEADSILKAQREEARAAAEEQKQTYEALVESLRGLTAEIGKINQGEAIKLKTEVDMASVTSAVDAVRQAFASTTFAIRVAATAPEVPTAPQARAAGGPIFGAGTATSDSIPALLSNGEHVLTAAEVRAAGGHQAIYALRAAMLGGRLPRFAAGGMVGGLAIPAPITRESGSAALQPVNITMPGGQTYPMQAAPDVARAMDAHIRTQVLKRGRF